MSVYVQSTGKCTELRLFDLPAMDQLAVLCLRGLGRGADLTTFLANRFGPNAATKIMARCDDLSQFLNVNASHPLTRLAPGMDAIHDDELRFAHLCHLADMGTREELLILATNLCRADLAPCLVPLAEMFVLSLKQALASASAPMGCPYRGH